ncbi:KH domain-containing protein [Bacillus sp. 2205SS5-2]|uniref:KH domain-containing protein n=1 Tax=Bacillus sp. 2205SS5-2 TaxID=3109031 RepID=UPI00300747C0
MTELLQAIVKPIVDHPEQVSVTEVEQDYRILLTLSVHPDDMGKVIGKQGRIAKAIRTVVYAAAGSHQQKKTVLEIVD